MSSAPLILASAIRGFSRSCSQTSAGRESCAASTLTKQEAPETDSLTKPDTLELLQGFFGALAPAHGEVEVEIEEEEEEEETEDEEEEEEEESEEESVMASFLSLLGVVLVFAAPPSNN